ncbi:MAG TPA: hypothetical protein VMV18_07100 [bacterium]|nr:hypothetical protein [bacterium]
MKILSVSRNPLQAALATLSAASRGEGRSGVVLAFRGLGDAVSGVMARSDRTLSARRDERSERFARAQELNVAEIDRLSGEVTTAPQAAVAGILRAARIEVVRACRSQVRKIRISRARRDDAPGGES